MQDFEVIDVPGDRLIITLSSQRGAELIVKALTLLTFAHDSSLLPDDPLLDGLRREIWEAAYNCWIVTDGQYERYMRRWRMDQQFPPMPKLTFD